MMCLSRDVRGGRLELDPREPDPAELDAAELGRGAEPLGPLPWVVLPDVFWDDMLLSWWLCVMLCESVAGISLCPGRGYGVGMRTVVLAMFRLYILVRS